MMNSSVPGPYRAGAKITNYGTGYQKKFRILRLRKRGDLYGHHWVKQVR